MSFKSRIQDPRRQHGLQIRRAVERGIEAFFEAQGFLQVRTPLLVWSPGMETHIRPYKLETGEFLPTSPEFAMKKLLVGGLPKIFQICPAFRREPESPHHLPEFTLLEWYRAHSNLEEIQNDFEKMVEYLALQIHGKPELVFQGQKISVQTPWPRLTVKELFQTHLGFDLTQHQELADLQLKVKQNGLNWDETDTWDDLYFKLWLNCIEPKLPKDRGVFVTDYPPSQAALAVVQKDANGFPWARRFEPYAGGLELGNAFEELTDPIEQRRRFIEDMELRTQIYGADFPQNPIDETFIQALEEGMPPSGGIAVGVDRLIQILADEPDIDYTVWLKPYLA